MKASVSVVLQWLIKCRLVIKVLQMTYAGVKKCKKKSIPCIQTVPEL